jgi:putative transport protein
VAVTTTGVHAQRGDRIGPEMDDSVLLDIPIETLDVVVTNRSLAGKSLADLARLEGARGVFLRHVTRAGQQVPLSEITLIDRGDVLSLIGTKVEVERAPGNWDMPIAPRRRRCSSESGSCSVGLWAALGHRCRHPAHHHPRRR